ncbi:hypothetical protein [Deinococcus aestuarii]|uniref:hypothetical protein n=1 Tax=Deinococcus aestuarii TaxID=2774531 RepID=UPI001C0B7A09|nr:hypothetical protein [Deinococcus aestuarii]
MNPFPRRFAAPLALAAALAAGTAGAQDLAAYRALAASLEAASQARPASAERALAQLDRAETALAGLAPSLRNPQIAGGLSDALGRARGALARTPAEVQAQVLLARGLMRRALYDQTLTLLADSPGKGAEEVRLLGREFGLGAAAGAALAGDAGAARPERVAWRLQRAAASKVGLALGAARAERTPAAYLNLARAASWFTVVQDAGGAGGLQVAGFDEALRQLTAGDTAGLTATLRTLRQGAAALNAALATAPRVVAPVVQSTAENQTPPQATSPAPTPARQAVRPPPQTSPDRAGGVDGAYAALGRALTAAGHGDGEGVRAALGRARAALSAAPGDLSAAGGYDGFLETLTAAQDRRAPRPADVQALIAGLGAVEREAAGERPSRLDAASAGASHSFGGGLRAAVFLGLALLALVPLYLLNLAFGGRNASWRAITAGLVLLLLPVFLEGVFGFLGWLGDRLGVPLLAGAGTLTLTQGAYGVPLWALTAALGIGLVAFGFRGLCVQFGLIGRPAAPRPALSQGLDWDEEPT